MTRLKCVTPYQIVFQSTIKQPKKDKKEKSCGKDQDQENLDEASFDLLPYLAILMGQEYKNLFFI